jgi:hypothetical protein
VAADQDGLQDGRRERIRLRLRQIAAQARGFHRPPRVIFFSGKQQRATLGRP